MGFTLCTVIGIDSYWGNYVYNRELAQLNIANSDMGNRVFLVQANYAEPPMLPIADEVIIVAPGGTQADVQSALSAAGNIVAPNGRIYVVTDLSTFNNNYHLNPALDALNNALNLRGLSKSQKIFEMK